MTKKHIVCVGDSITFGYELDERSSYPSQLQKSLESTHIVKNLGFSSRTVCSLGDLPYRNESNWQTALTYSQPDICIFMLGTNDTKVKHYNSGDYLETFKSEYIEMLTALKAKYTRLIVMIPPPCVDLETQKWRLDILNGKWAELLPVLAADYEQVNLYELFGGNGDHRTDCYLDDVHLNEQGYNVVADELKKLFINENGAKSVKKKLKAADAHDSPAKKAITASKIGIKRAKESPQKPDDKRLKK